MKTKETKPLKTSIIILASLFVASWLLSSIVYVFSSNAGYENVALIPIKGTIVADENSGLFSDGTSSLSVIEKIEQAKRDPKIKAVIFEINSGGGGPVASEEIAKAIESINKTTVAWIREVGASGAYWSAAATDKVYASRLSIVGSIGVLSSSLEFSKFLEEHNVTYNRLVAGKYKDIGTPLKEMTPEERYYLQEKIDGMHEYFLDEVVRLRNLSEEERSEIETAMIYTGDEALDLGLVDEIGTKEDIIRHLEQNMNTTITIKSYADKESFFDMIGTVLYSKNYYLQTKNFLNDKNPGIST